MCAVLDSLSCFFDLLNYQKREIEDTFDKLLNVKTDLLIDGMLIGTYNLPVTNTDFKLFLRDFYTRPVILKDFSLDVNPIQTTITCKITYDNCAMVSKPLFSFSNQILKNVELIKKQLKNLSFSYKLTKTHLWFQVMESSNIETDIRFFYNDSLDKYASSPSGMSYNQFLINNKHRILYINHSASVPMPGIVGSQPVLPGQPPALAPVPLPPPQPLSLQALSLQTSSSVDNTHETPRSHEQFGPVRRLYPDLEHLVPTSRPSIQGSVARLDYLTTARLTNNHRIIQDVMESSNIEFDTDMLKKELKKNAGLLNLVLHGVISLTDKRVQLSPEPDQTEGVTNDLLESDNIEENSTKE